MSQPNALVIDDIAPNDDPSIEGHQEAPLDLHGAKKTVRARVWMGTFNNPDDGRGCSPNQMSELLELLHPSAYVFQLERGASGTPHYQIVFQAPNAIVRPTWLHSSIHWEAGKSGFKRCAEYCSKLDSRVLGPWCKGYSPKIDIVESLILYPWQQRVKQILDSPPDSRKIYWLWESTGNAGKTTFCKWICRNYSALYLDGKAADCKYAVQQFVRTKKLHVALFDYVRSKEDFVSYEALESIKNGIFFSGKYEAAMCMYDTPHIFIFANFEPCKSKLSQDRWVIHDIRQWANEIDVQVLNPLGGLASTDSAMILR